MLDMLKQLVYSVSMKTESYYEITKKDIGRRTIKAFGKTWRCEEFIGRILPGDVGKRVFRRGEIVQVENDEQRAKRLDLRGESLRAAAPDLLEAVEALLDAYAPRRGETAFSQLHSSVQKAEKAICKAKGLNVQVYDNGGKTADRYTVVYLDFPAKDGCYEAVGMSAAPFHPQGFCQHTEALPGEHLGAEIGFADLPKDCQTVVRKDLENCP